MNTELSILADIGLSGFEESIFVAATTANGELTRNPKLKLGLYNDTTYFIFRDSKLMKIGKVGGGSRCLYRRISDYRSVDPTGIKISNAIKSGSEVKILAIIFETKKEEIFGIMTEGAVRGPKLEKALMKKAEELGISLQWNTNKG